MGTRRYRSRNVVHSLNEAIETERDNLAKADSVLGCLVIAMEYGTDAIHAPYYPDVAQIARNLVQQSLRGLDALSLQQRLRNKVKDEIHIRLVGVSAEIHAPLVSSAPSLWRRRVGRTLRIHRREYGARKQLQSL
jgi:hypothetical protein